MNLSVIQYDVIMQAIDHQSAEIIEDGEQIDSPYTIEQKLIALNEVKDKIIHANTPT